MPSGSRGQKRPADVTSNAVDVMNVAAAKVEERPTDTSKNPAAVALGRKGGEARAKSINKSRRRQIAKAAAKARWTR